ncbi:MAG TPA: WxcM-like domain-containing protein [Candidatus Moranbacteria bacterium]|nr:WxcM-like domain-containing protein [Candidatus Moranbacteria bacterium]
MPTVKIYNLDKLNINRSDERGWIVSIAEFATKKGYKIKNIHTGSISPGKIRGNHLHRKQKEWVFIFGGKGIFSWKEGGKNKKQTLNLKDHFLFEVEPRCPHAIKNIDSHDIYVCAFTNQKYNPKNPDRILAEII